MPEKNCYNLKFPVGQKLFYIALQNHKSRLYKSLALKPFKKWWYQCVSFGLIIAK